MKDLLERHLPLLPALRRADAASLRADSLAGLTTAIMLVPQGMAYATLAGLPPISGLYASALPVAVYALLGTSRELAVGPVAMVSLLVASGVAPLAAGDPASWWAYATLLALMVGAIQLGMGIARLGALVRLLSHPVIAGFTSAAALIIGASQLGHMLGVDIPRSKHVHEILLGAIARIDAVSTPTLAVALLSVAALVGMKRYAPRIPRFLVVVVAATLAVWGMDLDGAGVAIVGAVPGGLPPLALPSLDRGALVALLPSALTISLIGFVESVSVAAKFAREGDYEIDASQELKALGLANLAAAVTAAYPVTGGFSRTAVNARAGARSGLAGLITAAAVALTLLLLTPLFSYLPRAALAAVIATAVAGLVDVAEARRLWRTSRPELALMGLTFVATLTLGIEPGIAAGVAANLLWRWFQQRGDLSPIARSPAHHRAK